MNDENRFNIFVLLAVGFIAFGGTKMIKEKMLPRGIRNNNPLNIRKTDVHWVGQDKAGTDKSFVTFHSPEYGYRAAAKILASYARRGIVTLDKIIETWAPHNENPTNRYVEFVVKRTGIRKDKIISTETDKVKLFEAMTYFENGTNPHDFSVIRKGIRLA